MLSEDFYRNLIWNIKQITVQTAQAERVNGRARSGYYKVAIILVASVVEALAFKVLEKNKILEMPPKDWQCKNSRFFVV